MSDPEREVAVMAAPERPAVTFVVPCHNEELVVEATARTLLDDTDSNAKQDVYVPLWRLIFG